MKSSVDQTALFQQCLGDLGCFNIVVMPSQRENSVVSMAGEGRAEGTFRALPPPYPTSDTCNSCSQSIGQKWSCGSV